MTLKRFRDSRDISVLTTVTCVTCGTSHTHTTCRLHPGNILDVSAGRGLERRIRQQEPQTVVYHRKQTDDSLITHIKPPQAEFLNSSGVVEVTVAQAVILGQVFRFWLWRTSCDVSVWSVCVNEKPLNLTLLCSSAAHRLVDGSLWL